MPAWVVHCLSPLRVANGYQQRWALHPPAALPYKFKHCTTPSSPVLLGITLKWVDDGPTLEQFTLEGASKTAKTCERNPCRLAKPKTFTVWSYAVWPFVKGTSIHWGTDKIQNCSRLSTPTPAFYKEVSFLIPYLHLRICMVATAHLVNWQKCPIYVVILIPQMANGHLAIVSAIEKLKFTFHSVYTMACSHHTT